MACSGVRTDGARGEASCKEAPQRCRCFAPPETQDFRNNAFGTRFVLNELLELRKCLVRETKADAFDSYIRKKTTF